jgi:hypothetical protein
MPCAILKSEPRRLDWPPIELVFSPAPRSETGTQSQKSAVSADALAEVGVLAPQLRACTRFVLLSVLWLASWQALAGSAPASPALVVAQQAFEQARARSANEPASVEAAWQSGRASFDLAEFATNNTQRAAIANEGIAACRKALARSSNSAPAHYYLGLNLGQLARTQTLGALKLVGQMEREWTTARELDEQLDYGGPDRSLGLLYRDAPSIGSVGSRSKAREHLQRALKLAPGYPDNLLNLVETEQQWGYTKTARDDLKLLEATLPAARTNLVGPAWISNWEDWDKRLQKARKSLEEPSKSLVSPRQKGG